jgi:hypothetical protein
VRVQRIADAVAEQVDRQYGDQHGGAWEDAMPFWM